MAAGYPVKVDYANGDVLTATNLNDLAGTVNFAVSPTPTTGTQMAGKNAIINGDFTVNQRSFSSTTTTGTYGFDRFPYSCADGTVTYSAQTFTSGTAPVAGYEAVNFARIVTTGQTATSADARLIQRIENVRTFAGQTVTISFWAKANSGTPNVAVELVQSFGSGGSPSSNVAAIIASPAKQSISTSWARYSFTINVPSISGKTIGTTANSSFLSLHLWVSAGSDFNSRTGSLGIQTNTFDFWGVQAEAGSDATPFQTATGTVQGELAACQRYYWRTSATGLYSPFGQGSANGTTGSYVTIPNPVTMRAITSVEYANLGLQEGGDALKAVTSVTIDQSDLAVVSLSVGASGGGLTTYRANRLLANNNSSAYLAINGEL